MSLTKRIKGDFTIETVDTGADDTITLDPAGANGVVVVAGNLTVQGTTTTIDSTDTTIVDNTIILNSGEDGPGITHISGTSGIDIDLGYDNGDPDTGVALDMAGICFNGTLWQVNNGTGAGGWTPIVTGTVLTAVVDDLDPHLGGDLIVAGYAITSEAGGDVVLDADTTGAVKVNHKLSLEHESTPASYNDIYADAVGSGGTGLFTGADEELVSNRTARIYGLIF